MYNCYVGVYLTEPTFERFFVADGVYGLPIIASSFSLNVVVFFLADPARLLDFCVVFKEIDAESFKFYNGEQRARLAVIEILS